ncbi:MAG: hypothetical protein AAFN41_07120, partial [Planctomycetota bacterium]
MDTTEHWADRIERLARLTLPDAEAVRAQAAAKQGRRTTARLLVAAIVSETVEVKSADLTSEDDRLLAAAAGLAPLPQPHEPSGPMQPRSRDDV